MSLYQQIVDTYRACGSIRMTANRCGCSREIARRVAITEGLITCPRIEQIHKLSSLGLSNEAIAQRLKCAVSTVAANSPYQRGIRVDQEITKTALRVRKYRARKKERKDKHDC